MAAVRYKLQALGNADPDQVLAMHHASGGFKQMLCGQVTKEGQEAEQIRSSVAQEEAQAALQRTETANLKGGLLVVAQPHFLIRFLA